MISVLILNSRPEETAAFRKCFGDIAAIESEERLEWYSIPDSTKFEELLQDISVIHMAILDAGAKGGLESAKKLREESPQTEIMIVADLTISPMEYMTPEIKASSLLLRPFPEELLEKTSRVFFTNCLSMQMSDHREKTFLVENSDGKTMIPYSSIYYFEAREKKIFVRTAAQEYGIYDTIENLQAKLPEKFLRCHRSYIVNGEHIDKVRFSENLIFMEKDLMIPLSRTYKNVLKEYLNGTETS